ncbi:GNAT family N-acetyltransferase [Frondihabitans sp. Leaf304]|uniref:GNAT family N-acetyltransferase n=1 Tax=Frondihabitans sp. Leaf304 TaxID=1736329 RepID=UPI0009FE6158|nr:GNAT family N-acetyltransferase [Frondihabitans sp. Leaf304]
MLQIREMTAEDVDDVDSLSGEVFPIGAFTNAPQLKQLLVMSPSLVGVYGFAAFVAYEGSTLVGYVYSYPAEAVSGSDDPNGLSRTICMLAEVATRPSHRHSGVATSMINDVVSSLKRQRQTHVVASCESELADFYRDRGWQVGAPHQPGVISAPEGDSVFPPENTRWACVAILAL